MKECKTTDRDLNAWLDGELSERDASRQERLFKQNPVLRRHADELHDVRRLVRRAFPQQELSTGGKKPWRTRLSWSLAAGIVLCLGFALGWVLHPSATTHLDPVLTARGAFVLRTALATSNHPNILVHISSDQHKSLMAALDETEKLLQHYQQLNHHVRLEVVANGGGIKLLRDDSHSPYAARIRQLQNRYKNLTFLACRNTLDLLREKRGGQPQLMPSVVVGPSALEHVIQRLEEGWAYIKV